MRGPTIKLYLALALVFGSLFLFSFTITAVAYSSSSSLIITELYPNTEQEQDEYVAITNPCARSVNLEGWSLTDNEGKITFPQFRIAPGDTLYVTRNASAFVEQRSSVTIHPAFEYGLDSDPEVGNMQQAGKAFVLRNSGDEVILQDEHGRIVDAVIYGGSSYKGAGWRGKPLKKPREGMILKRKGNEDTDTANDWVLIYFDASYHAPETFSTSTIVTAFVSPDNSFAVLQQEIENASASLCVNLYEFANPKLLELVLDALSRGVKVQLLLEGSPIGGISGDELCIAEKIKERGGKVRFSDDPFINHAKYAIIDDKTTILMSENWKSTGVPCDNTFGNRGWGIVLRDSEIASYFKEVFAEDFRRGNDFSTEAERGSCILARGIPHGSYVPVFEPLSINCDFTVIPVLAPDSALSDDTILGMISSAQECVHVQQFSARLVWGEAVSPFIAAIISAARRGCEVKVLLDSKYLEGENNNDEVVSWLNELASVDNLSLEARLADLDSLGLAKVHNKGLIVDGEKVLICSLNWNANSVYNREAGVIVENADIAGYYEQVFFHDWDASIAGIQNDNKGTDTKMRIVYVAFTFVVVFFIFRVVMWYNMI